MRQFVSPCQFVLIFFDFQAACSKNQKRTKPDEATQEDFTTAPDTNLLRFCSEALDYITVSLILVKLVHAGLNVGPSTQHRQGLTALPSHCIPGTPNATATPMISPQRALISAERGQRLSQDVLSVNCDPGPCLLHVRLRAAWLGRQNRQDAVVVRHRNLRAHRVCQEGAATGCRASHRPSYTCCRTR